jgi:hypothetical protein
MFERFARLYHLDPEDLDDEWTLVGTMGSRNIKDWFVIEQDLTPEGLSPHTPKPQTIT